jgi:hypothetical protein
MSARGAEPPFPNPSLALTLAVLASLLASAIALSGTIVGAAFGAVLGYGGIGFLAARVVPEPVALRLGLTPFPLRALAPVLLLAPGVLLVSEIDTGCASRSRRRRRKRSARRSCWRPRRSCSPRC